MAQDINKFFRMGVFLSLIFNMKVVFQAVIQRFGSYGEKTGWTYIEIPASIATQLKPGTKVSFRVKGKLDSLQIEKASLLPMGQGNFVLPINKSMRSVIKKPVGATLKADLSADERTPEIDPELLLCLRDEPRALDFFYSMPGSHQRYFSKWITGAKTPETKARRITKTIAAMLNNKKFNEMMKDQ